MSASPKCLITGVSGFIGRHLAQYFHQRGYEITGIGRKPKPPDEISDVFSKWISCDFSNPLSAETVISQATGVDYFFHLAAQVKDSQNLFDLHHLYQSDIIVPLRIIDGLAKNLKHICFFSSTAVYGKQDVPVDESSSLNMEGLYGTNKSIFEDSLFFISRQRFIPVTVFRVSSVYGPGMPFKNAIPKFIFCLRRNERPSIFSDPHALRDYVYVEDLAPLMETAIKSNRSGTYNIASGFPISLSEVIMFLNDILGKAIVPQIDHYHPEKDQRIVIAKAQKDLSFQPTHPRLGLQRMIESNS